MREATRADAAALGALHVASWRESYAGLVPPAMLAGLSVEARAAMWAGVLDDPSAAGDARLFVAEDGEDLIGFGSCAVQRDAALAAAGYDGEIGAIYVLRAHQRRGIGRSLIAAMAGALLEQGHAGVGLWVPRDNAVARRFYDRLGGVVVGKTREDATDATLVEIAYGWSDLSRLRDRL